MFVILFVCMSVVFCDQYKHIPKLAHVIGIKYIKEHREEHRRTV